MIDNATTAIDRRDIADKTTAVQLCMAISFAAAVCGLFIYVQDWAK